ncbi:unnamed protein product [Acanthoscelides obtectus]|uniref:Uncharacterized protein n=1 Tax=Acanthoscelides obtectus TaxID=200917 RepID=A0A9P0QAF9_ACAOB|nr:unnamed protein product [Acanthoscelides obtectus]CAK1683102.1 hypothetical protein AOBTE_LOCUS34079 [Acanthoscelides obtectus]
MAVVVPTASAGVPQNVFAVWKREVSVVDVFSEEVVLSRESGYARSGSLLYEQRFHGNGVSAFAQTSSRVWKGQRQYEILYPIDCFDIFRKRIFAEIVIYRTLEYNTQDLIIWALYQDADSWKHKSKEMDYLKASKGFGMIPSPFSSSSECSGSLKLDDSSSDESNMNAMLNLNSKFRYASAWSKTDIYTAR